MKNALKAAAIVGIISLGHLQPVHSSDVAHSVDADYLVSCEDLASHGKLLMEVRQVGAPMHEIMQIVENDPVLRPLAIAAYEAPLMHSQAGKTTSANEFATLVYRMCVADRNLK